MYQALYRKWRPQVFADVVGQEHITTTLMNEIKSNRHSHAYLFTGSRGTGKTTCAKIFAKAVNCEHPANGDPCNECETCRGLDSGAILDVIEIDAASNNGVDNIRDIRDEANFTPVSGKYRVYIIDEVHMLSQGAFNALLKTLEEPPEHVKFVLATTEVHKLPATILSRCQRFDFKRISPNDIASRLAYVAEKESLTLDNEAALLIARLADGALRDALSILDQCIGHSRNITVETVNETVGLAGKEYLFSLSNAILENNGAAALETINELHNHSCDMDRLCNELINHFRNIMICKAVKSPQELIICSEPELNEYIRIASAYQMDRILEVLNVLGETLANLRKGLNRRVETEMAIIRLCANASGVQLAEVPVTPRAASTTVPAAPNFEPNREPISTSAHEPVTEPVTESSHDPITESPHEPEHISLTEELADGPIPTNIWNALIREVVTSDKALIGTMNSAKAYKLGEALNIVTDNMLLKRFLPMEEHKQIVYNATFTVLGEYLHPIIVEEAPPIPVSDKTPPVPDETPSVLNETAPIPDEAPPVLNETVPIPDEAPLVSEEIDPLDAFINSVNQMTDSEQIDFSLFIEE